MAITEEDFNYYREEMINGDSKGAYNMAYCYLNGEGVEQNYNLGLKYLKVSAGLGYVTAIYKMFCLYNGMEINGLIIDKDYSKKIEYAKVLSSANLLFNVEPEEQKYIYIGKIELAVNYANSDRPQIEQKKGFIFLKELADMGFPDAQYYTALCYINAIGTNSDYNAAKQYVNKCMYNEKNDVFGNQNSFKNEASKLYYNL